MVFLSALAAFALPAEATVNPQESDPDFSLDQTVKYGIFHAAPFLTIKDFGYDDNVRLTDSSEEGDWTFTVSPGARAVMPLGRLAGLALREQIDYVTFASQSDLNYVNNNLRAKLHAWLRDVTLLADGEQISSRDRPSDEIDYRLRHVETKGRFGAHWKPEGRLRLGAYFDRFVHNYDAGEVNAPDGASVEELQRVGDLYADLLERVESEVVLDARLKLRSRAWLLLESRTGRIEFERSLLDRDSDARSVTAGLEMTGAGPLTGYFRAGYGTLTPDDSAALGYDGFVGQARIAAKLFGRGQAKLAYDRRPSFSVVGDNLYYIHERRGLSWEHFLSRRLSVELGRDLTVNDYPVPINYFGLVERKDDVTTDRVSVRYRLGPSLRVGLGYEKYRRDSSIDDEDAVRNLITTNLEYTP